MGAFPKPAAGHRMHPIHQQRNVLRRRLSPHPWAHATIRASLARDGAFGSSTQRGKRPAPGRVVLVLEGPRSRRPGTTASDDAPVMARKRWPPSVAQGVIAPYRATGRSGKPKQRPGTQIAATRVPEGNPGTVRCGEPQGSQGDPRGSPGLGNQPRVAAYGTRVTRRTLAGISCGAEGACWREKRLEMENLVLSLSKDGRVRQAVVRQAHHGVGAGGPHAPTSS